MLEHQASDWLGGNCMQREGSRAASTNKSRDWSQEPDDVDIIPNLSNFIDVQHSFVAFVRSFVRSFSHVVNQWLSSLANLVIRSISWSVRHCAIRWFSYLVFLKKKYVLSLIHAVVLSNIQRMNGSMNERTNESTNRPNKITTNQPIVPQTARTSSRSWGDRTGLKHP